jgi:membrane protein YdbS with pleckstrin-like domain
VSDPRDTVAAHGHLRRYVLANERIVVATRRHWSRLLEPILTTLVAFVLVGTAAQSFGLQWLWVAWLLVLGRLAWRWLHWYNEWFVATDKRLILAYGVVIHKVAMMPLVKVTDMGYSRTPMGQVFGYGRFIMESAGQDQALRQVDWVPDPDDTYRKLCATIFLPGSGAPPGPAQKTETRRPPALVPGNAEPRPTTQPIPVVGRPDGSADGTGTTPTPGEHRTPQPWTPGDRGRYPEQPKSGGGGPTIPEPFL